MRHWLSDGTCIEGSHCSMGRVDLHWTDAGCASCEQELQECCSDHRQSALDVCRSHRPWRGIKCWPAGRAANSGTCPDLQRGACAVLPWHSVYLPAQELQQIAIGLLECQQAPCVGSSDSGGYSSHTRELDVHLSTSMLAAVLLPAHNESHELGKLLEAAPFHLVHTDRHCQVLDWHFPCKVVQKQFITRS